MDLTNLALFRAVALEQSVSRAAQSLQRAQSNVTTRSGRKGSGPACPSAKASACG